MKSERIPWFMAGLALIFHALANPHYGFFRDELYFIICGRHPAFGYVDQPPLTPLLAAATQIFGHSLFALRLIPALCAAATVYVTCLLVREMRGGKFAQIFASVVVLLAPILAAIGGTQNPDMLEMALWPLAALFVLRITNGGPAKWWLGAGLAIGVAFESKYSVVFFVVALLVGLLISAQRRILLDKWFLIGVACAIALMLPNLAWQAHYGFPMVEVLKAGQLGKNIVLSPGDFILSQIMMLNPAFAIVWLAGLFWMFRTPALRWLGYGYVLLIGVMIVTHAKDYYPAAVYPILIAAGGCVIEAWTARAVWARPVVAVAATAFGLALIPIVLPVLPVRAFIAYQRALHLAPGTSEHHKMRELPQEYADMHGWPEFAAAVGSVYDALPPEQRAKAVVFTGNYGEASAVEFFNPHVPVTSGHNQYWLWGPRGFDGSVVIDASGGDCGRARHLFGSITKAATFSAPYVMAYEDQLPLTICAQPHQTLQQLWPELKHYE